MTENINLASLTQKQGFSIIGELSTSSSVSDAGDFNGDGFADFIIGYSGMKVYVIYGSINLITINLINFTAAQGIIIAKSMFSSDKLGFSTSGAGDINRDGYDDIIIGAPGENYGVPGKVYIIYGGAKLSNINIDNLTPSQGVLIYANSANSGYGSGDLCGYSVSGAGDMNRDGYADIIIGCPNMQSVGGKISYVLYGGASLININLATLTMSQGFSIAGVLSNDYEGWSVSSAGDINNDGKVDVIIGAYMASHNLEQQVGISYVIYGGDNLSNINLASLTTAQGFSIYGAHSGDNSGNSVAKIGDINGDGISDIIIGSPVLNTYFASKYKGVAHIIYGSPNLTNINLANLDSSQGFSIIGPNYGDQLGYSVSGAGDINGDGMSDIIIGAPMSTVYTERGSSEAAGISYVIYGAKIFTNINLANLCSAQGFSMMGRDYYDKSGYSVSSAGDVNGDGYADVIIGSQGIAYIVYGVASTTEVPSITPTLMSMAPSTSALTRAPTVLLTSPTTTPSKYPTLEPTSLYLIVEITYGGSYTYTDVSVRENFIINSPTNTLVTGGSGADKFTILPHEGVTTTITNFDPSDEIIDLSNFADIHSINDFSITYKAATILNLPNGEKIKLLNVMSEDIVTGNFIFSPVPTTTPSNDDSSKLSYGAIVGIFAGGAMLLSAIGYIVYAKSFNVWPFVQAVSEEASKGQYNTIELVENAIIGASGADLNIVGDALDANV